MEKTTVIELFGGTVTLAAKALGISYQALKKWPEYITSANKDKVVATLVRSDKQLNRRLTSILSGEQKVGA